MTIRRCRGVNKWWTLRLSSEPVVETFSSRVADDQKQAVNSPVKSNRIKKIGIVAVDGVPTIGTYRLTDTPYSQTRASENANMGGTIYSECVGLHADNRAYKNSNYDARSSQPPSKGSDSKN